jgi:hypothetical protein
MKRTSEAYRKLKSVANRRGGQLCTRRYTNMHTKLLWRCKLGHSWKATGASIKFRLSWCPECAGNGKKTIRMVRNHIKRKGGTLHTKVYLNQEQPLEIRCSRGHDFTTKWRLLKRNIWCKKCAGLEPITLQCASNIAKQRGGEVISKTIKNARSQLAWKCAFGHKFQRDYNSAQQGNWCPTCSGSFGEELVRVFLQECTGFSFPRVRLRDMQGPKGYPLEFDGYCKDLRIAFEHQGPHHYPWEKVFHPFSPKAKRTRGSHDSIKVDYAQKRKITLIVVPWIPKMLAPENLGSFLFAVANKHVALRKGLKIDPRHLLVDWEKLANSRNNQLTAMAVSEIGEKGGRLESELVGFVTQKISVTCGENHRFQTSLNKIRSGRWCPECGGSRRRTIEEACALAKLRGGRCVSSVYQNAHTKLIWRCSKGHDWPATYNHVKSGTWCPRCAGRGGSRVP